LRENIRIGDIRHACATRCVLYIMIWLNVISGRRGTAAALWRNNTIKKRNIYANPQHPPHHHQGQCPPPSSYYNTGTRGSLFTRVGTLYTICIITYRGFKFLLFLTHTHRVNVKRSRVLIVILLSWVEQSRIYLSHTFSSNNFGLELPRYSVWYKQNFHIITNFY